MMNVFYENTCQTYLSNGHPLKHIFSADTLKEQFDDILAKSMTPEVMPVCDISQGKSHQIIPAFSNPKPNERVRILSYVLHFLKQNKTKRVSSHQDTTSAIEDTPQFV